MPTVYLTPHLPHLPTVYLTPHLPTVYRTPEPTLICLLITLINPCGIYAGMPYTLHDVMTDEPSPVDGPVLFLTERVMAMTVTV